MKKTFFLFPAVVLACLLLASRPLLAKTALFDDDPFVDADHLPLEEDY